MEEIVKSLIALEKIKRPLDHGYLVYTYILNSKHTTPAGYFIPLFIAKTEEEANEKAKEIILLTDHKEILTYPMGKWISLGDSTNEKISRVNVREDFKDYALKEEEKRESLAKERKEIEKDIEAEDEALRDPNSIESYYHDWVNAVMNKQYLIFYREEVNKIEEAYRKRIENINEKQKKNPQYKDEWKDYLKKRLKLRKEEKQGKVILDEAEKIRQEENL